MSVKIRCVLVIISVLLFFMLIGLTRQAFAVTCSYTGLPEPTSWIQSPHFYDSQSAAQQACQSFAAEHGKSCFGPYNCSASSSSTCSWRAGYIQYWVDNAPSKDSQHQFYFCNADPACPSQRSEASSQCGGPDKYTIDEATCQWQCNVSCPDERASLEQQCGGIDKYTIDEASCKGRCNDCVQEAEAHCGINPVEWNEDGDCSYRCLEPCQDLTDRLSYGCGGSDQMWFVSRRDTDANGNTTEQCAGGCGSPPDPNRDTDGDGNPDRTDDDIDGDGVPNDQDDDVDGDGIPNGSDSAPTVPGGIDMSNDPGAYGSENPDPPPPSTDPENPDPTFDCVEKYNNKVKECGEAGIASWDNETCTGRCKGDGPCTKEQMDAADAACPKGYTMNSDCTASCKTCSSFESDCVDSCKPAAVKTNFCEEQNGAVVDVLCECENASGCQQYKSSCDSSCAQDNCGGVKIYQCQEDSTGKITSKTCECNDCGKPDVPDPKNPEPDDPDDMAGWLKGIKRDTEQIADNTASVKQSVDGLKGSIDGLKDALSDVTIKGSGIGSLTGDGSLGTGGSVTGAGYGTAPADGDLPAETSFGTFTPRTPGSDAGGQISAKLNTLSITALAPVCSFNFSYPLPRLSGLSLSFSWQNYPVNFCEYESLIVMIGNLLVFFTALSELYKFA